VSAPSAAESLQAHPDRDCLLPFKPNGSRRPSQVKPWVEKRAYQHWIDRGRPNQPSDDWTDWFAASAELERQLALAQGENLSWMTENRARLTAERPEWRGRWLAIASRTEPKVLAAASDWQLAWAQGSNSPSLLALAERENLPADVLLTVTFLDDPDSSEI
jgi:hypothetical protein